MILGSIAASFFEGTDIRTYMHEDLQYTYTLKDLMAYSSDLTGQLFWVIALRRYARMSKITRCSCQWYIDLIVVDLIYVVFSNPMLIEKSKLIMMAVATVIFLIIYYLEYISLWHSNWVSKRKDTHGKLKKL